MQDVETLIKEIINEYKDNPIDMLQNGDGEGEYQYISMLSYTYIRTIRDVIDYLNKTGIYDFKNIRVLEVGAFLGVVSIALSKLGFCVTAADLPIFQNNTLLKKYEQNNIAAIGFDLKDPIPFNNSEFDVVIMCETLEHLNFNPIPVMNEINRVIKHGGLLYVAVPNIAVLRNRVKLLIGRSINDSIDTFFRQLDVTNGNMVAAIHWKEYTAMEVSELISRCGFIIKKQYYTADYLADFIGVAVIKRIIKKIVYALLPSYRNGIVTIATNANS